MAVTVVDNDMANTTSPIVMTAAGELNLVCLVSATAYRSSGGAPVLPSFTFDGNAMTQIVYKDNYPGGGDFVVGLYRYAPASYTGNKNVAYSGGTLTSMVWGAVLYAGANQSDPIAEYESAQNLSTSISVTFSTADTDGAIQYAAGHQQAGGVEDADYTEIYDLIGIYIGQYRLAPPANDTITDTCTNGYNCMVAAALKAHIPTKNTIWFY